MITRFHQRATVALAPDSSALFTIHSGRWPCMNREDYVVSPERLASELHAASELYPVIVTPAYVSTFRARPIFVPEHQVKTA